MKVSFNNINITGIATALPSNKLEMLTFADKLGKNQVKRIIAGTGIRAVRVAKGIETSDLFDIAANTIINTLGIDRKSIDGIIFVSQTPDRVMPATSVMMQHRLGISKEAVAFDINYGCSGYIYGLYQASMLISSGGCNRVILFAGDIITPLLHPDDYQVRMVLGDAGSVTLVEKGNDNIAFVLNTDGSGMQHLHIKKSYKKLEQHAVDDLADRTGYLHMNGAEIMTFALREVPFTINELLSIKGWQVDDVGTFALHQPNTFMLNYLRKKMQLSSKSVPISVEDVGNTGPASIPLTLSLTRDHIELGNVVMCGFGAGLSWAAAGLSLANTTILAPVEL